MHANPLGYLLKFCFSDSLQHDVVMGILTVRENIYFSAALRLPSLMSSKEKKEKVDKLINELGLTKVADSKVRKIIKDLKR